MTTPNAVPTDTPHAVPVSRDLAYEIAAVSAAILDAREEKTRLAKTKNLEIKALEKRQRELIETIRSGGDVQLAMKFGTTVKTERALASTAPGEDEDDDRDDEDLPDVQDSDDDENDPQNLDEDEAEALGATH